MKIKDLPDGKHIVLSAAFDNRAKILNIIYFLFFTAGAFMIANLVISGGGPLTTGALGFILVFGGIYLFAAYRFINKALQSEHLIVNKNLLTLRTTGFMWSKDAAYDTGKISNFRHLDKPETTRHALAGESFDYLGFQTEQQVINELHGDKRLAFDYDNRTVKFGENMYSWDFEVLEVLLYDITGNDLRYSESFEKTFLKEDDNG